MVAEGAAVILERPDGHQLAYEHTPGSAPGILFLGGFNSNMQGEKARALEAWCQQNGRQFTRFDYLGHGQSSGEFQQGTIGRWIEDALAVVDDVAGGPLLLVGSSMGGWIMLHVALARPQRVAALVGIATATDFTESMRESALSAEHLSRLELSGSCAIDNCYDDGEPYIITRELLDEGRRHCLLQRETVPLELPVRLLHGQRDADVPWQHSLTLAEKLRSDDVEVCLVKDGDHRLSRPQDLLRLERCIAQLLEDLA